MVLLALVALASRAGGPGTGLVLDAGASRVLLDSVFYLLCALAVLGALLAAWALWPRPELEAPALERPSGRPLAAGIVLALAVAAAVWWRATHGGRLPFAGGGFQPAAGAPPPPTAPGAGGMPSGFDWPAAALVALLLAAAAAWAWRALLPGGRRPATRARRVSEEVAAVVDDAVEDVLGELDPRSTVIGAWARLERVLAGHGVHRLASEAPFEYTARACSELALPAEPLERLAGLYEWARFSVHEVTPAMREEALAGFLAVRAAIRTASPPESRDGSREGPREEPGGRARGTA